MITITLPWPAKELSPNARVHWAKKSKFTKSARYMARMLTVSVLQIPRSIDWIEGNKLRIKFIFHPADKRRRDLDNLISSTKAHRDGIADAIGIDDSRFILSAEIGDVRKPACVVATIS